jgi:hypothetical protein
LPRRFPLPLIVVPANGTIPGELALLEKVYTNFEKAKSYRIVYRLTVASNRVEGNMSVINPDKILIDGTLANRKFGFLLNGKQTFFSKNGTFDDIGAYSLGQDENLDKVYEALVALLPRLNTKSLKEQFGNYGGVRVYLTDTFTPQTNSTPEKTDIGAINFDFSTATNPQTKRLSNYGQSSLWYLKNTNQVVNMNFAAFNNEVAASYTLQFFEWDDPKHETAFNSALAKKK